ncbi:MAG: hypothetical protein M2R45_00561 [Verrucomicrobia subdivision 3 bacterium]|nr:hypothetical protein [Limisphaerales bacterium]MCS1413561.1 hypothetical protein [Limisphaerales bacterium]
MLLSAIAEEKVPACDLNALLVRQLRNLNDPQANRHMEQVRGIFQEPGRDNLAKMAK